MGPGRRHRDRHPVERPADAGDLADRSGARRRQHRRRQAAGVGAAHRLAASPTSPTRPGCPPGVFNVVQGLGAEAGAPLVAHPDVRRICFTGSVPTSVKIGEAAARNVTPVSFELGGKSPLLVFDDADLDLAVDLAVEQFDNSGQVCLAAVRILVQDGLYDEFRDAVPRARRRRSRRATRATRPSSIGPLVSRTHLERVDGFVQRAVADGAHGRPRRRAEHRAQRRRPAASTTGRRVFEGVDRTMEITCQEVFGPVLTLQRFGTEDEGVAMANDTDYGLAATHRHRRPRTAPSASPRRSGPARSGSTASSSATCPPRSAAADAPGSAARAAPGPSTSTATSRTRSSHREDGTDPWVR